MKKLSIFLCAVTAIAALACNKEIQEIPENPEPQTPQVELFPMTFTAITADTRTVLDNDYEHVLWADGEKISVFDGAGNQEFTSGGAGRKVTFSGNAAQANVYYALYPHDGSAQLSGTSVTTTLASAQTPRKGSFADGLNINAAQSTDKTTFVFDNVLSVAKFTLDATKLGGKTIKSVKFASKSYPLAGSVAINFGETCTAKPGTAETFKEVSMTDANGLADGTYFLLVLPNAGGEITMTFTATDNSTATITANVAAFGAGRIKNLGTVQGLTWEAPIWKLVTDASTLAVGDKLVIASNAEGKVASNLENSVLTAVDATFSSENQEITLPASAMQFKLGGSVGAWTLTNSEGKILKATAVKKLGFGDTGTETWSISIQDGNATIQNATSSYGKFLYNVGSPRFTTYTSNPAANMLLPQLYREEPVSGTTPIVKELESNLAYSDNIKKVFKVGETFSFGEGTVTASYSNGETKVLSLADVSVAGFDSTSPAESQAITLSYSENGKTATASYAVLIRNVQTYSVTYTVATTRKVEITSGVAPEGSSESFANTYNTANQMTGGKSQTLTLSGYTGVVIKGITLSMHSNARTGSGHFTCYAGNTLIAGFTDNKYWREWYNIDDWSSSFTDVFVEMINDEYEIKENEQVVIKIEASANSLFNQSFTLTYEL